MRQAIVSGQFYPEKKEDLIHELEKHVKKKLDESIKAAIVPHAGYLFSGKCAGKVYSLLPNSETYAILGVNHNSIGEDIAISLEDFETPLGIIKNNKNLGKAILESLKIEQDNEAHKYEHSIEVQLPFLQYTQKNFMIVPVLLKNYNLEVCKKLAKIIVLASSDFTHTGPAYDFSGSLDSDKIAIKHILNFKTEEFMETAEKTTICGAGAIATAIEYSKIKAKKAELLCYYDSSQVIPSENKVGYAGIVFR